MGLRRCGDVCSMHRWCRYLTATAGIGTDRRRVAGAGVPRPALDKMRRRLLRHPFGEFGQSALDLRSICSLAASSAIAMRLSRQKPKLVPSQTIGKKAPKVVAGSGALRNARNERDYGENGRGGVKHVRQSCTTTADGRPFRATNRGQSSAAESTGYQHDR